MSAQVVDLATARAARDQAKRERAAQLAAITSSPLFRTLVIGSAILALAAIPLVAIRAESCGPL